MEAAKTAKTIIVPALLFVGIIILGVACGDNDLDSPKRNPKPTVTKVDRSKKYEGEPMTLPEPVKTSDVAYEKALNSARTRLDYNTGQPLSLENLSQLLFAAQGVVDSENDERTTPSFRGEHVVEVYAVVKNVNALEEGIYHYVPGNHAVGLLQKGDLREGIVNAVYSEDTPDNAPVIIVVAIDTKKTGGLHGDAEKQALVIAGRVTQNIYLQAESLDNVGVGTVTAFDKDKVQQILNIPEEEQPVIIIPVGKNRS